MTVDLLREALVWCSIINIGLLLWWVLMFTLAHDWLYRFHGKLFKLSEDQFNMVHYAGIAFFKICIFLFNLVPYIALRIIT